jgi:hypothetical protein
MTPRPLDVLDGLVAGLLPMAMRAGGTLRVRGPLTREAVRNLTEYAETWAHWAPRRFHRVEIVADAIVDGLRPAGDRAAIVAWSGSLRSTHTLVRHAGGLVAAAFPVRAALRVLGLHPEDAMDDDAGLVAARAALAATGIPLLAVRTSAAADGLIDPEIGALPIVAAALHAAGAGHAVGLHARRWLLAAQLRYPRPEPALTDLLSGAEFTVRADGGAVAPPRMVADLAEHPSLASTISDCRRVPRHRPPCGRCAGCTLLALAFAAASHSRRDLHARLGRIAALPFADPTTAADAEATLAPWRGADGRDRRVLAASVALARLAVELRDTGRWLGAAAGVRAPWPR